MNKTAKGALKITVLAIINGIGIALLGEAMAFLSGAIICIAFILGEHNAK